MTAPSAEALVEPPAALERFDVMFRPGSGRWKKVGTATGYAACLALVDRAGDFWFRRAGPEPDAGGPSLFDEPDDAGPR